jgi:hypothetical protein
MQFTAEQQKEFLKDPAKFMANLAKANAPAATPAPKPIDLNSAAFKALNSQEQIALGLRYSKPVPGSLGLGR